MRIHWHVDADVIVVGYGAAGAVAAITACDGGSRVLILEKQESLQSRPLITNSFMSQGWIIGTSDIQGAMLYMKAITQVNADLYWTDKDVIQAWARYTSENVKWLEDLGTVVRLSRHGGEHKFMGMESINSYQLPGGGAGLMRLLYHQVKIRGIEVRYNTPAVDLLMNAKGDVAGVQAKSGNDEESYINVRARRAVILTTGGFEFDEQMKLHYLRVYPSYFLGSPANTGDGIRLAMRAGAQLWHMNCCSGRFVIKVPEHTIAFNPSFAGKLWSSPGGTAVAATTAKSTTDETSGRRVGYIVVDRAGKRYTKETIKPHTLYYELTSFDSQQLSYPRVPSYWIFDQKRIANGPLVGLLSGAAGPARLYKWSKNNSVEIDRGWIKIGDTIKELGVKLGIPPTTLVETVNNYNLYCRHGEDIECKRESLTMVPLDTPPFYAVELWPGGPNTQGGPRRNSRAQIVRPDGTIVHRLYSAGELGSIYGMLYPSGGGNIAECIAFGRIAGENANAESPQ